MKKDKFIFVHIPKTAGTSFFHMVEETYGKNKCKRDRTMDAEIYSTRRLKKVASEKRHKGLSTANIIHGHFDCGRYKHLNRPQITFVRNPVDRLISEYFFLTKNSKGKSLADKSIREYAKARANVMMDHCIKDINNFEFIGVQEYFDESLTKFEEWAGIKLVGAVPWLNLNKDKNRQNPKTRWEYLTEADKKYIRAINYKDCELYYKILNLFEKNIKK